MVGNVVGQLQSLKCRGFFGRSGAAGGPHVARQSRWSHLRGRSGLRGELWQPGLPGCSMKAGCSAVISGWRNWRPSAVPAGRPAVPAGRAGRAGREDLIPDLGQSIPVSVPGTCRPRRRRWLPACRLRRSRLASCPGAAVPARYQADPRSAARQDVSRCLLADERFRGDGL